MSAVVQVAIDFYCCGMSFQSWILFLFIVTVLEVMSLHVEQRNNIKFLTRTGRTPKVWRQLKDVYGDQALSYTQVRMWHRHFHDGREESKDNPCSGQPSTRLECVEAVCQAIQQDWQNTLRELSAEVQQPPSTVSKVLRKDLNMKKHCAKFIPHLLTDANKWMRKELCLQNLANVRDKPHYLDKIVSGDET